MTPAFLPSLRQTCQSCFSKTPKGGCVLPSGAGLLMASQHFLYAFAWGLSVCAFIFRADLTHQPLEGPGILKTACLNGTGLTPSSCCPLNQSSSSWFERCLPLIPGNNKLLREAEVPPSAAPFVLAPPLTLWFLVGWKGLL